MRGSTILRQVLAESSSRIVQPARIPTPRGDINTPAAFLSAIGRDSAKKLSGPLSGWQEWDDMWKTNGEVLKDAGVGVKDRRYFLWCLEKFRAGGDPSEFAIPAKPKKKFRGWDSQFEATKGTFGVLLLPSRERQSEGQDTTASPPRRIERTVQSPELSSATRLEDLLRISATPNGSQGEYSTLPDGVEYVVVLEDRPQVVKERLGANWGSGVPKTFSQISKTAGTPLGFGCLVGSVGESHSSRALVLHRTHFEIFGALAPDTIAPADAVNFLRRLYRPWGAVKYDGMGPARGWNFVGEATQPNGPLPWSFDVLETAERTILSWLERSGRVISPKVTIDVVIASYRVQIPLLHSMLELIPAPTCSVEFIVVVDDPHSPSIARLTKEYRSRPDVHILVNNVNCGASASRNRGMWHSTAEWVHFFDDDIVPSPDLLLESERAILHHPKAAGFVGNVYFPPPANVATTAIKLSGVTSFWDIANRFKEDVPWGVTGNLVVRRGVRDGISFDLRFPKTGGGEDIDFCLRKSLWSKQNGGEGLYGVPEMHAIHPWWNNGGRTYERFFKWAKGDGALMAMFPQFAYSAAAPNGGEVLLCCVIIAMVGLILGPFLGSGLSISIFGVKLFFAAILVNVGYSLYGYLLQGSERSNSYRSTKLDALPLAVAESALIRMTSEMGRTVGVLHRREWNQLGRRFDWWAGRAGTEQRIAEGRLEKRTFQIWLLFVIVLSPDFSSN
ncbi:hypothetical protein FS837_004662 [Tulasnella sp. UAMH 9824]|nr:hypothetical protein FS837_004662 [Tulasnella sp. UAMH 9824]